VIDYHQKPFNLVDTCRSSCLYSKLRLNGAGEL